jgi:hypothetical protein
MAQYAGICKEGDTNKGLTAAARDATTINALNVVSIRYILLGCFYPNLQSFFLVIFFVLTWIKLFSPIKTNKVC